VFSGPDAGRLAVGGGSWQAIQAGEPTGFFYPQATTVADARAGLASSPKSVGLVLSERHAGDFGPAGPNGINHLRCHSSPQFPKEGRGHSKVEIAFIKATFSYFSIAPTAGALLLQ
jgi:hypothetical protein